MPIPFLFLPPQGDKTRDWARRLGEVVPELEIIAPETMEGAEQAVSDGSRRLWHDPAEPAGTRRKFALVAGASQAAPPAGYYYPELIAHPVREHQRGASDPRDHVRHRVGFSRAGHAEQRLIGEPVVQAFDDALDRLRLVAGGRERLVQAERAPREGEDLRFLGRVDRLRIDIRDDRCGKRGFSHSESRVTDRRR